MQSLALVGLIAESSRSRYSAIDRTKTQYRKDADHALRGGQNDHLGRGCGSLPAPQARANPSLATRRGVFALMDIEEHNGQHVCIHSPWQILMFWLVSYVDL
jgi:hypothetical protein